MPDQPLDDQIMEDAIQEAVNRAVGRLEGALPPEALEEMKRLVRMAMRNDPASQRLLREIVEARTQRPQQTGHEASEKKDVRGLRDAVPQDEAGSARRDSNPGKAGGERS